MLAGGVGGFNQRLWCLKWKPAGSWAWTALGYLYESAWERKNDFDGVKLSINVTFLPGLTFKI